MTIPELLPYSQRLVYSKRLVYSQRLVYSLYIHIPFCHRRCSYCDFNTYAGLEKLIPAYVAALCAEIRLAGSAAHRSDRLPLHTVFLGGGTPSLLPLGELERIFSAVRESFYLLPEAEISLEANPGTVDLASLQGMRQLGVNRLSLGMQSAHGDELELLGRIHSFEQVVQALELARAAGFGNLNLDAIFGLPEQPLARWEQTLRRAVALEPEHLSLYALTLEAGTPLLKQVEAGGLPEPDPDLAADMYDLATELLGSAGYLQYEISNWAKHTGNGLSEVGNPAYACRHNLQYWRNGPYLGVGAGAHSYIPNLAPELLENSEGDPGQAGAHGYISVNPKNRDGQDVQDKGSGLAVGYVEAGHIGAGAKAGFIRSPAPPENGVRIANVLAPKTYIQRLGKAGGKQWGFPPAPAAAQVTEIDTPTEIGETMMMGLRLVREGVSRAAFRRRFGRELEQTFATQIERLAGLGLLEWAGTDQDVLRLTHKGRFLGNQVFVEFI